MRLSSNAGARQESLAPCTDSKLVEVLVQHRTGGFWVIVKVPEPILAREVKQALISILGHGHTSQVRLFVPGGFPALLRDEDTISSNHRLRQQVKLLAEGFSLRADSAVEVFHEPTRCENEQPPSQESKNKAHTSKINENAAGKLAACLPSDAGWKASCTVAEANGSVANNSFAQVRSRQGFSSYLNSSLLEAVRKQEFHAVQKLLSLKASVNATTEVAGVAVSSAERESPLALAVRGALAMEEEEEDLPERKLVTECSHIDICEELIRWRADVNITCSTGTETLLIESVLAGSVRVTSLLLRARADASQKSSQGQTILTLATSQQVADLLINATLKPEWSDLECRLYASTQGQFNPDLELQQPVLPWMSDPSSSPYKVSVICPSLSCRAGFHSQLYKCFTSQSYPDKELVFVETGREPSSFFNSALLSSDPRIVYRFYKDEDWDDRERRGTISIGLKRNMAIRLAKGAIIAHFDDDDIYSPEYLQEMVDIMCRHGAHMLKLSSWFVFDRVAGRLGYCDPEVERGKKQDSDVDSSVFGYGFSYVYRRDVAISHPFPDKFLGEDYAWLQELQGLRYSVCLWPDLDGICLHLQHGANTSDTWAHDIMTWDMLNYMQVAKAPALQELLSDKQHRHDSRRKVSTPSLAPRLFNIAWAVLWIRAAAIELEAEQQSSQGADMPTVAQIVEERNFCGCRKLEAAFNNLGRCTKLVVSSQALDFVEKEYLVPWTFTVLEAKRLIARDCGERCLDSQVRLVDAESALRDDRLLLSRRYLRYTVVDIPGSEPGSSLADSDPMLGVVDVGNNHRVPASKLICMAAEARAWLPPSPRLSLANFATRQLGSELDGQKGRNQSAASKRSNSSTSSGESSEADVDKENVMCTLGIPLLIGSISSGESSEADVDEENIIWSLGVPPHMGVRLNRGA